MRTWPIHAEDEIAAARVVLESGDTNYWTGGQGRAFESEYAAYMNARYAIAVANGTVALELALLALGVGAGDDVVLPARTFIGTATAVVARGARPVIADVDRDSGNITAATIRDALTPRTRAVVVVHLAGWPCEMDEIMALAAERNLFVIEDCAQAHGAQWDGKYVGTIGHIGAFSFCQDKIISTAGEGGMLVTDDHGLWRRAWEYKDHGRSVAAMERAKAQGGFEFKWVCESFGTNWRMTEVQCAIGRLQLRKLDGWLQRRYANSAILDREFAGIPGLRVVVPPPRARHAYYKYYVYIIPEVLVPGWSRSRILDAVNARGIACFQGICPEVNREKAFLNAGFGNSVILPVARELGDTSLMFLVDPTLAEQDMIRTAEVVHEVMGEAVEVS